MKLARVLCKKIEENTQEKCAPIGRYLHRVFSRKHDEIDDTNKEE